MTKKIRTCAAALQFESEIALTLSILALVGYLRHFMIDIHCHILPDLDDGSDSMETSLGMAEMAIEDGVTHVIGTPHANSTYAFAPKLMRERREELQEKLGERLAIATGCDFHLTFENIEALRADPLRFTLNQKNYLLVEFGDFSIPPAIDRTLHELQLLGLHLIITHPERNPLIRSQWELLWNWMRQGCLVQVTAQAITGGFGSRAQAAAGRLLDAGAIHFIASDAHNLTTRPLRLKAAFEAVAEKKGEEMARALFESNPRAALEGRPLPYLPEPAQWKEAPREGKPRKRFWFF
ncbi:MAG TPA: CpsB/CapC family capsule biosynthesis tyrosine phosphatase [Candidatus Acidoferrales bacterium]|nr:CpsB/CapC family capsule biosynthesis tyrosine phosphatase [Candidatus Acidoferrales bacterium]